MTQALAETPVPVSPSAAASGRSSTLLAQVEWTGRFSDSDLVEVEVALREVRRAALPILNVGRDQFPLPRLGAVLDQVATVLDQGPGFVRLTGLPIEEYGTTGARMVHWALSRHLGLPVSQDALGRMTQQAGPTTGGLRTGGSDVESWLALEAGQVSIVSGVVLYDEVSRRRPDLVDRLNGTFAFDRDGQHGPGEQPFRELPLFCLSDGRLSFRYDRAAIESAQRFDGVRRLDATDRELLDLIDELIESPELRLDIDVAAGDLLLVNNHEVLHRRSVRAHQVWLTLRNGRELPASYIWPTPAYADRPGRGGVTPVDEVDPSRCSCSAAH